MLRSIKQLYEVKLRASDADIGHVKDFYFDDQKWVLFPWSGHLRILCRVKRQARVIARKGDDSHLRSTRDVTGYHLQTAEETIGHVTDFMMDSKSRGNCHLVVETGSWYLRGMQLQPFPDSIAAFIASNSTKAASKS